VVERLPALIQEALLGQFGRYCSQAQSAALGPLARQTLRQGNSIRVRLGEALAALALPGSRALALPRSRELGDEAGLLELRDGSQNLPDENRCRGGRAACGPQV
jgi:hypothetical protein